MFDVIDESYAWMGRDAIGWDRSWGIIASRYGDTVCRCQETGESWQYMGTYTSNGVPTRHCFRHRSLNGQPRYDHVEAQSDDLLPQCEAEARRPDGEMAVVCGEEEA